MKNRTEEQESRREPATGAAAVSTCRPKVAPPREPPGYQEAIVACLTEWDAKRRAHEHNRFSLASGGSLEWWLTQAIAAFDIIAVALDSYLFASIL